MPHSRTTSTRALAFALSAGFLSLAACDAGGPTGPLEAPAALSKAMGKTEVCHRTTNGQFREISVANAAYGAHIAHGDGGIGEPVPGMAGYKFDDACQPVEASLYFSLDRPDIVALESAMSTAAIDNSNGNRIPVGAVMVYRTANGMYGKLVVLVSDASDNNGLTVRHETYQNDGSILISVEQFTIRGTWLYSLTLGTDQVGLDEGDFKMENRTSAIRQFTPRNGAKFALIGIDPAFE